MPRFFYLYISSNPQTLKPSNPQTLKPSCLFYLLRLVSFNYATSITTLHIMKPMSLFVEYLMTVFHFGMRVTIRE